MTGYVQTRDGLSLLRDRLTTPGKVMRYRHFSGVVDLTVSRTTPLADRFSVEVADGLGLKVQMMVAAELERDDCGNPIVVEAR